MTNIDRIRQMTTKELIAFLKMTDFTKTFPVIEGEYFFTDEDLLAWLEREIDNERENN